MKTSQRGVYKKIHGKLTEAGRTISCVDRSQWESQRFPTTRLIFWPSNKVLDPGMDSRVHTSVVGRSACGEEDDASLRQAGRVDGSQYGPPATLRTHWNSASSRARFERIPAVRPTGGGAGARGSTLGLARLFAGGAVAHFCGTRWRGDSLPECLRAWRRKTSLR